MSDIIQSASDACDRLTDAAYSARLLHELLLFAQDSGYNSYQLSDCAIAGLAAINRHIFDAVIEGRNQYIELLRKSSTSNT